MMRELDDGRPAFPDHIDNINTDIVDFPGMSLRDWFAGKALPGMLDNARHLLLSTQEMPSAEVIAHAVYKMADAMIAERSK